MLRKLLAAILQSGSGRELASLVRVLFVEF